MIVSLRRMALSLACVAAFATAILGLNKASAGQNRGGEGTAARDATGKTATTWVIQYAEAEHSDKTGEGSAKSVIVTTDEGTVLHADRFQWNDRTRVARAEGNLRVTDPEADATGNQVEIQYARSKRLLILTGGVRLTIKPREEKSPPEPAPGRVEAEPAAGNTPPTGPTRPAAAVPPQEDDDEAAKLRKYPIEVTCDRLEYQYARDKKLGVLRGNFRAAQKLDDRTRTLTADHAEWHGLEDLLILKAPVKWEDTKGNSGSSTEDVRIYTKQGEERVLMKNGTLTIRQDDDDEPPARPQASPPNQTPPAGGEAKPPVPGRPSSETRGGVR